MRRQRDADRVILHVRRDDNSSHQILVFDDSRAVEDRIDLRIVSGSGPVKYFFQLGAAGVLHQELVEEPIKLRFRQRIGSLLLERVLRGHDEKGWLELANLSA